VSLFTFHGGICRGRRRTTPTSVSRCLLAVSALLLVHAALAVEAKHVLVIHTSNRLSGYGIAVESGLRQVLDANPAQPAEIFSEFLDEPRFGGDRYELTVTTYLHDKYADHQIDAVVPGGDAALEFILRHRDQLFPRIPVLYLGVTPLALQSMPRLPPDVVGVPIVWDFAGTVELALKLHPRATRLVIVQGASKQDDWESVIDPQIAPILGHVQAEYWVGLPLPALQRQLRELGGDCVVLTMGFHRDRDGRFYLPGDAIALVVAASSAPVYSAADVALGSGVVGGRMLSYEGTGRQYGQILERLFSGQPDWQRMPESNPSSLQVDWRQIKRWGIDPRLIPPDAIVSFRPPTLWQAYRNAVVSAATIILLLSGLVIALLLERQRRRTAEVAVRKQHTALAHASRLAVAGELTAAIAHEINQPLGAAQMSADAAELILQAGGDRREDLLRVVGRIRNDTLRASEVIKRLRTLLARHEARRELLDLNVALTDVEVFLRPELKRRDMALTLRPAATPARILGDETQIQQVLINLIMNAMDASGDASADRRTIAVQVQFAAGTYSLSVQDQGSGLVDGDIPKLFDSFFSTKRTGMGLGLPIARTIVEAHGGTIQAANSPGGGAIFYVRLPAHDASQKAATG
jgi:signal transduction histidine kinase